jgi:hypothetical protein
LTHVAASAIVPAAGERSTTVEPSVTTTCLEGPAPTVVNATFSALPHVPGDVAVAVTFAAASTIVAFAAVAAATRVT